jgi:hypothetical protein
MISIITFAIVILIVIVLLDHFFNSTSFGINDIVYFKDSPNELYIIDDIDFNKNTVRVYPIGHASSKDIRIWYSITLIKHHN